MVPLEKIRLLVPENTVPLNRWLHGMFRSFLEQFLFTGEALRKPEMQQSGVVCGP